MAFLTLPGAVDVPVDMDAGSAELEHDEVGGRRRAINGTMHSTVRAFKRRWSVRLVAVPRATGDAIMAILQGTMPISCSGDLLGAAVDCHAEPGRILHPKFAAGEYQLIQFVLHEE